MSSQVLSEAQVRAFIADGFVRMEHAFARETAEAGRRISWRDTGCDPDDPGSWTKPIIRLGGYADQPFSEAVNTPVLRNAFDQLVGEGRWLPRASLGTFPIRFPSSVDPGDTGWHIDTSFEGEGSDSNDFLSWRVNIFSRGRALAVGGFAESAHRPEVSATGEAGTVYLCHPFLVHAAQPHRGRQPRFMAQPPLHPAGSLCLDREDGAYPPVEQAIRQALS